MHRTSHTNNGGIKARARTGAHPEAPQITWRRGVKSFDLATNGPGREHRYRNHLRKSKVRRGRERKSRVNEPRVKGCLTRWTTSRRVLRGEGGWVLETHVPRIAAADLAGSRNLRRAAAPRRRGGRCKKHPAGTRASPFSVKASTRRGGDGEASGDVADRRERRRSRLSEDGNRLCLMAWVAYRRSVDTQSE